MSARSRRSAERMAPAASPASCIESHSGLAGASAVAPARRSASASTRCCSPTPTARRRGCSSRRIGLPARGAGARGDLHRPQVYQTDSRNSDDHRYLQTVSRKYGAVVLQARQRHLPPGAHGDVLDPRARRCSAPTATRRSAARPGMLAIGAGGLDVAVAMGGGPYFFRDARRSCACGSPARCSRGSPPRTSSSSCCGGSPCAAAPARSSSTAGPGLPSLLAAQRMTIANMGAELGLTTSVFPSRRGHALVPHAAGPRRRLAAGRARRRRDLRRPDRARPERDRAARRAAGLARPRGAGRGGRGHGRSSR